MLKRAGLLVILWVGLAAGGVHLLAQVTLAPSQTPGFPLWAYGHIAPPDPPEDWSERCLGTRPRDCDRPGGMPTDPSNTPLRLELPESTYDTKPKEKILIEADSFSPSAAPLTTPPNGLANLRHFYQSVERLRLDVEQVIPIHGPVSTLGTASELLERFRTNRTN